MEDAVGAKSLTSEEKEKIKERLCLLKKEYKRTFNRLRRSQRAERVKTHVQKTIAEQNHLLSQEGAGPGNRGSQSSIASNDADLQSKSTRPDTERKPCVTFNFEPEILCAEGSSPCCSVSGSSGQELDGTEKPQDMGQAFDTTIQRSRLKLRRSTKRRCSADQSLSDGSLFSDTLKDTDGLQGKVMDRSDCGLPVFKKSAKHPMDQNHVNLHDFSVGPDFGTENLNTAALDTGNITDFLGGNVDASPVTREQCLDNKIQVKSGFTEVTIGKMQEPPMTPGLENIKEPLLSPCLGKIRKSSLLLCTDKPREPSLSPNTEKTRTPPLCLSPNIDKTTSPLRSRQKDKTEPPPADIETSRELSLSSYMEQNNTLAQKDQTSCDLGLTLQQGHTHSTPHIPTPLCSDEQNLLNQINNVQDTTTNTGEDNNPLNSCTLVEGLLFPVEYYVRTTRRMSNCQRKVDLDAIIHSQLGTSRRGSRGKPRSRRVSGEEGSIYTSPSPMACFASEFISNALCLTPLSHQTPNSNKHGANRGRRGRGRYSSPKLELPQVSSSHDVRKRSSLLEPDAVASPISNGSQSEKENCEEQTTPRLDPHSAHLFAPYRTEQPHVTEGLNSEQIYILPNSDQKSKYNLRSRNSASLFHYSLPDDMDDFDNGSINQNKLKRSIEFTDNQKSERQRSCLTPSSPFPALSSRMSLEKLLSCLEIKDFHLPDDDFGFLKLQKLKSLSQLEPFVPLPTTETGRTKPDNTTLPGTDYSTAFQATIDSSVLAIKPSACTLYNGKSNAAPPDKTASKAILCVEIPNAPSQEHVAYSAHSVELPPPVSQVRKSQETVLNHLQKRSDDIRPCEVDVKPTGNESVPHASPLPSKHLKTQTNSEIKLSLHPCEELGASGSSEFQIKSSAPQFPLKEVPCSVLLATSMCSMPLETSNDTELASCTPGFPFLGSTPAALSAPSPGGSVLTPCSPKLEKPTATINKTLPAQSSADELKSLRLGEVIEKEVNESKAEQCIVLAPGSGSLSQYGDTAVNVKPILMKESLQEVYHVENCAEEFITEQSCGSQHENPLWTSEGGHLRLISQIQDGCFGKCMIDLCSVQWEFPSGTEMCIVGASESAISLWRPHSAGRQWEAAHSWIFTEMPVIQILPLPGEKNIMCVALGNLEILEIWALFSCPRGLSWEQRVVKLGHTETARGLSKLRLVCSSGLGPNQEVEILQLSEKGRTMRSHTLQPPEASILSFSEVEGEADAVVGSTVDNKVVIWNGATGQLLSTINVGELCGDSACLSAYSDSGLLFLLLASPYSNSLEAARKCIFTLIAANPKSERCAHVMSYTLPEGQDGRYLEGDIISHNAAAVLTSGSVAFWDLPRSHCSALLITNVDIHWSLVRWTHSMSQVLAGQKNGTIYIYSYTGLAPKEKIKEFEKNGIS
ncbi:hypothetical protein XENTR_v10023938 [Xenopus tropicalis]|uniref:Partner and localizer of BRCA2 n=1 Tax=Xenopus tropicalis TaxID=8364 RepID=A0A6I8R3U5_XENTR|nr:partner and localizer of BRCA2 [Xenopus tropicalis]KAE8579182.1 hypothetical protein XENTR_v10023938 [Xenopus tropicalis]